MTDEIMNPEMNILTLPISSQSLELARQFAQQQSTPAQQERVQLNTLAVCTVNDYLEMMGFETDLCGGDSWNPIARMCADVADLEITNIGKVECRPVVAGETEGAIPPEVWLDRIGYMFVEINLADRAATMRGFIPQARGRIALELLRSPLDFIDHLHQLMAAPVVKLHQWLEGFEAAIAAGWLFLEPLESLFVTPEYAFRSGSSLRDFNTIKGGKLVDLGIQLEGYPIALIVELSPVEGEERTRIYLKVCPTNQSYLLPNIQLIVLDESQQVFLEAQSRTADNLIQLEFTGNIGEKFEVVVKRGNAEVTGQFTI
jgi:Protein of unknown function (DUF1822)